MNIDAYVSFSVKKFYVSRCSKKSVERNRWYTFPGILIEGDYLYIDKTEIARNLIEKYQYVFLSRPRRFGKSLFLDTLKDIFEGNRELFRGLLIEEQWNWKVKYPVINISFGGGIRSQEILRKNFSTS